MDMENFNLKNYIRNKQADDKTLLTRLYNKTGYNPKAGALSKWLGNSKQELSTFEALLIVVRDIIPDHEIEAMAAYSKTLDPNKNTARVMLEYLTINRRFEEFGELLEKMLCCNNNESKEWATIYSHMHEWQVNFVNVNHIKHANKIQLTKTSLFETFIFQKILGVYACYYEKEYKLANKLICGLEEQINEIEQEYIRTAYLARIYEIISYMSLKVHNDPEKAREYAQKSIDHRVGTRFVGYAYFVIGLSYIFESYDKSKMNFEKSIQHYAEINYEISINDMKDNIELLDAFWGVDRKYTKDKYEYYYKARNGEKVDTSKLQDEPHELLIKGVINQDVNDLIESIIGYLSKGDAFFAQIPRIELAKMGYNERFLNKLLQMK